MFRKSFSALLVPLFLFIASSFAFGAALSINPTGNGVYTVQGSGMDGVAAIEMTVTYDSASLASPAVSQGSLISGAIFVANTNIPGSIKIAIASTKAFSGSGPIVVITFANRGSGNVQISNSKLIDDKGAAVTATSSSGSISSPGIPFSQPSTTTGTTTAPSDTSFASTTQSSTSTTSSTTTSSTSPPTSMGTVTIPGDSQPKDEALQTGTSATEPPQQTPPVAESLAATVEPPAVEKPAEPTANVEAKQTVYGSVLERFRTYQGEKTPATMMALFAKEVAPAIHQEPVIAISDGKTNVLIIADLPASAGSSPNFALSGARMVTLKKGDVSGRWILEALPNKNTMTASVTILSGSSIIEYPLTTVSSAVNVSAEESHFADFLKDAGTKAPKRDLNADGRHDYLDDFIYTALYMIQKGSGKTPKK